MADIGYVLVGVVLYGGIALMCIALLIGALKPRPRRKSQRYFDHSKAHRRMDREMERERRRRAMAGNNRIRDVRGKDTARGRVGNRKGGD